jgi:hypothetical protein
MAEDGTIADRPTDAAAPCKSARFDYSMLGGNLASDLQATASRIRVRMRASVIDVGKDLLQVKAQLEHGQFVRWVESECGINKRTAQRMMAAAEWAEDKSNTVTLCRQRFSTCCRPSGRRQKLATPSWRASTPGKLYRPAMFEE